MKRRQLLLSVGTLTTVGMAGCTQSGDCRENAISVRSEHGIEDGMIHVSGSAGYSCHSGFGDRIEVLVEVIVDGDVYEQERIFVDAGSCGQIYPFAITFALPDEYGSVRTRVRGIERCVP